MALTWTELQAFISASPGAAWDEDHAQEIIDNVDSISATFFTGTFSGSSGTGITFADQGNTDYFLIAIPLTSSPGNIGEISYSRDSSTTATIYNSGSFTGSFIGVVIKNPS